MERSGINRCADAPAPIDGLTIAVSAAILTFVWRLQDLFPILVPLQIPSLSFAAAVALLFADKDRRRSLKLLQHPIAKLSIAFLMLMMLSAPFSMYKGLSVRFLYQDFFKTFIVALVLAASIRSFKDIERYLAVNLVGCFLYSYLVLTRFEIGMGGRLNNLYYYDANDLGLLIACTIPIAVFFAVRKGPIWIRLLSVVALPIFVQTIVKTGSRGAFLGLIAVGVTLLIRFRSVKVVNRVGAVAALVVLLSLSASSGYWEMMKTLLNPTDDYNWAGQSDGGRVEVWKRGMGYMLHDPITGVGVNAFPVAEGTRPEAIERLRYGMGTKWSVAHNSFVQVGAELGVGGLLVFLALLGSALRTADRMGKPRSSATHVERQFALLGQAMVAVLIGFCVSGSFLSFAYYSFPHFTLALVLGGYKVWPGGQSRKAVRARKRAGDRIRSPEAPVTSADLIQA